MEEFRTTKPLQARSKLTGNRARSRFGSPKIYGSGNQTELGGRRASFDADDRAAGVAKCRAWNTGRATGAGDRARSAAFAFAPSRRRLLGWGAGSRYHTGI